MPIPIKERKHHIVISIPEELYKKLDELKMIPKEPMYEVIQRLYDFYKKYKK